MFDLRIRSYKKELLDNDNIPFADIRQNMRELNIINRLLGGHKISIDGIKELLRHQSPDSPLTVCEIGCGGGDNLQAIAAWCTKHKKAVQFTGIDIKSSCINFAKEQYPSLPATWITRNYAEVSFSNNKPDFIFSSLFCHHFDEAELIKMLGWMKQNSRVGFFINDLHRHRLAYYSIKWMTTLFSKSYLVKNDAPLSVARGFKKEEWKTLLAAAGISKYKIQWKWAFRYLIISRNFQETMKF